MKKDIHPQYEQTTITCACGNVIETGSTKKDIRVEVCSKCHPFFTGKQKLVDTGGRVDGAVGIARQRSGLVTGVVFCACIDIEHEQGTVACLIVFEDAIATCGRGSGDARRRIDGAVGVTLEVAGCVCGAVALAGSHIKKEC